MRAHVTVSVTDIDMSIDHWERTA